jgi:ribosomal protein S18 acetylase RimI-like enzyme
MNYRIRKAIIADVDAIRLLLPRLASFDLPKRRAAEDLWRGDELMLLNWASGKEPDIVAHVAVGDDDALLGVVIVRMREELLCHQPSAHLEVIAVAEDAEGKGVGQALVSEAQNAAHERGAHTMTLHVFGVNTRARALYEKLGYDGEIIRYIKELNECCRSRG